MLMMLIMIFVVVNLYCYFSISSLNNFKPFLFFHLTFNAYHFLFSLLNASHLHFEGLESVTHFSRSHSISTLTLIWCLEYCVTCSQHYDPLHENVVADSFFQTKVWPFLDIMKHTFTWYFRSALTFNALMGYISVSIIMDYLKNFKTDA